MIGHGLKGVSTGSNLAEWIGVTTMIHLLLEEHAVTSKDSLRFFLSFFFSPPVYRGE